MKLATRHPDSKRKRKHFFKNDSQNHERSKSSQQAKYALSSATCFMLRVSRISCIAPVRFERWLDSSLVCVSPTLCLINFGVFNVINTGAVIGFFHDATSADASALPIGSNFSVLHNLVWTFDVLSVAAVACFAALRAPRRVEEVMRCLSQVRKIKIELELEPNNETKKLFGIVAFMFASGLLYGFQFYSNAMNTYAPTISAKVLVILNFPYYIEYFMMSALEMQFIYSTWEVYETFRGLNDLLENIMRQQKSEPAFPRSLENTVGKLVERHQQLTDVVLRLNSCFGPELLVLMSCCMIHLIVTPHNLIRFSINSMGLSLILHQCWWAVWLVFSTFATIEPCHYTHREMARTRGLVSRLSLVTKDEVVHAHLEKFSSALMLARVDYSAMGACKLTRVEVVSMISSVATYLVLLVQYDLH